MDALHIAANRCLVLRDLVYELGGLASTSLSISELDSLLDNMVSKGIPSEPSENLLRWIHTHRKQPGCKITQLLGVDVAKLLVPDCFGLFYDKAAPECKLCLDRQQCREKRLAVDRRGGDVEIPDSRIDQVYPNSKRMSTDDVRDLLKGKMGQIAKTLASGHKVVLLIDPDTSLPKVLVSTTTPTTAPEGHKENTMATKPIKPNTKKAAAAEDDEEEDETPIAPVKKGSAAAKAPVKAKAVVEDDDDEEEEEEEEEAPAPKATKKAAKPVVDEDEDEDADEDDEDEAPKGKFKPVAKEAKPKKEKAPDSKAVAEFKAKLKTDLKDDAKLIKFAKTLGATWNKKEDARINRMLCVMACTKAINEAGAKKK